MAKHPTDVSAPGSQPRAASVACTAFDGDVALAGKLAVGGQYCPVPADSPSVYVNGDVQVDGNLRTDGTARAKLVAFQVGRNQSSATLTANGEAQGQIGVGGALRVAHQLGVGTAALDDLPGTAQLVVRGAGAERAALQVWQNDDATNLGAVDRHGRLGVGTATPTASLEVGGRFLQDLTGTLTALANLPGVTGNGTSFTTQLRTGDYISIPTLAPQTTVFKVTVQDDTHLTVEPSPSANFSAVTARVDGRLASLKNGAGVEVFGVGRAGGAVLAGGLVVAGLASLTTLTAAGAATLKAGAAVENGLTVAGGAKFDGFTVAGGATLKGGAAVESGLYVVGGAKLDAVNVAGLATAQTLDVAGAAALKGGAAVTSGLSVAGGAKLDTLAVSGVATAQTLDVAGAAALKGGAAVTSGLTVAGGATLDTLTVSGVATLPKIAVSAWVDLPGPFTSGWTNWGPDYEGAGYCKDPFGFVYLRGLINNGKANPDLALFQLPAGFRPRRRLLFGCHAFSPSDLGSARVDVDTAGNVIVFATSGGWLSLTGIVFQAA